jgi:hypothetical protein
VSFSCLFVAIACHGRSWAGAHKSPCYLCLGTNLERRQKKDMAALSDIPEQMTAGDSIAWTKTLADYSAADGWVLSYALTREGGQITFQGSAAGSDHAINIAAATSADWSPGEYGFQAYVTKSGERHQVDAGLVEVLPNLAAQTEGYQSLPYCFTQRDALDAVMNVRATESQLSIAVGGRQISEMSHAELQDALDRKIKECNAWKARNRRDRGKANRAKVKVVFPD